MGGRTIDERRVSSSTWAWLLFFSNCCVMTVFYFYSISLNSYSPKEFVLAMHMAEVGWKAVVLRAPLVFRSMLLALAWRPSAVERAEPTTLDCSDLGRMCALLLC